MSTPETKHTQTPWSESATATIILAGDKGQIMDTAYPGMTLNEAVYNRQRIIACVNACEGIPNSALEAGAVRELIEALAQAKDQLQADFQDVSTGSVDEKETQEAMRENLSNVLIVVNRALAKLEGKGEINL